MKTKEPTIKTYNRKYNIKQRHSPLLDVGEFSSLLSIDRYTFTYQIRPFIDAREGDMSW